MVDISESLLDQAGQYYCVRRRWIETDTSSKSMHPLFTRIRQSVGDLYLYRYVTQNLRFSLPELTPLFRVAQAQRLRHAHRERGGSAIRSGRPFPR